MIVPLRPGDIWRLDAPLLLGSTSRIRRQLLEAAGLPVECHPSHLDERRLEDRSLSPPDLAASLAAAKALAVSKRFPGHVVIGADQVLACRNEVFHKPLNRDAAFVQIAALSGKTHQLHSAVALARDGLLIDGFVEEAHLTMRDLDAEAIASYLALAGTDCVTASVGGYQLEGLGIHLFARIEGDHSTILGLPLLPLLASLRRIGCLRI